MTGLRAAVERLRAAIERGETVLIYGDYDVDGTTAIVILKTALELCGARLTITFRTASAKATACGMRSSSRPAERGIRLIISVDTGIRAFAAAETAERCGIDLIVTDHHLPHSGRRAQGAGGGESQPARLRVSLQVAMRRRRGLQDCAGAAGGERSRAAAAVVPKMVAIATIADAVPLIGENRVFAKLGLEGLRKPVNAGLRALLANCDLDGSRPLSAGDIAFRVAPRLNAAGRMDIAERSSELFTEKDAAKRPKWRWS